MKKTTHAATCGQCGLPVIWKRVGAAWKCENPDGSDHWDLCSKTRFEKIRREGTFFEGKPTGMTRAIMPRVDYVAGYRHPLKTQFIEITARPVAGKKYRPDACDCGRPPWELCDPQCPHALQPRKVA